MSHQCAFCKKEFIKETSIAVHMCEPKRRRQERSERGVELAFNPICDSMKLHKVVLD